MNSKITIALLFISVLLQGQNNNPIENYAIPIRSSNPTDIEFDDLMFLKDVIGEHKIVLLGEATHNDGTSMEMRARLVKFLHQEMEFEVLAFETGFINGWFTNELLKNDSIHMNKVKSQFLGGGWETFEGSSSLFPYARSSWNSSKPLNIAGFDICKPRKGGDAYLQILNEIFMAYPELKYNEEDSILFNNAIYGSCGFIGNEQIKKLTVADYEELYYTIYEYIQYIAEKEGITKPDAIPQNIELQLLFLRSLVMDIEIGKQTYAGDNWNALRDKAMADRLLWMTEYIYPDKKFIIWAATGHLMNNSFDFDHDFLEYYNYQIRSLQMGDYIDYYGLKDQIYHIGFTCYQGKRGVVYPESYKYYKEMTQIYEVDKAKEGTFEWYAHQLEHPYLFVDIKGQDENNWMKKSCKSNIFQVEYSGDWSIMFDAFLFIDEMKPVYKISKAKD